MTPENSKAIAARFCYAPVNGKKLPAPYLIPPREVLNAYQHNPESIKVLLDNVLERGCYLLIMNDGVILADRTCIQRIVCKTREESEALADSLIAELTSDPAWEEKATAIPLGKHTEKCMNAIADYVLAQEVAQ
jgi:hypothetical protein